MYRQVCTRIRVGVWGPSQAPSPVADRANSSTARQLFWSPMPSEVSIDCVDFIPPSSGDIHDQSGRALDSNSISCCRARRRRVCLCRAGTGMPGISEGAR
jgi:hypothetical protein